MRAGVQVGLFAEASLYVCVRLLPGVVGGEGAGRAYYRTANLISSEAAA